MQQQWKISLQQREFRSNKCTTGTELHVGLSIDELWQGGTGFVLDSKTSPCCRTVPPFAAMSSWSRRRLRWFVPTVRLDHRDAHVRGWV